MVGPVVIESSVGGDAAVVMAGGKGADVEVVIGEFDFCVEVVKGVGEGFAEGVAVVDVGGEVVACEVEIEQFVALEGCCFRGGVWVGDLELDTAVGVGRESGVLEGVA